MHGAFKCMLQCPNKKGEEGGRQQCKQRKFVNVLKDKNCIQHRSYCVSVDCKQKRFCLQLTVAWTVLRLILSQIEKVIFEL